MERPPLPGDLLLGKYQIERVLGRGGMGTVFAARHIEIGETFAIKVMHAHARGQEDTVRRFIREARFTARLKSDHIVRVTDAGRLDSGLPYMVMEHLQGCDLAAVLRQQSPLLEDAVTHVLQACEALSEAHAAGIVHRDVKPGNLFLSRRPNGDSILKVLDFGIAKDHDEIDVELTKGGDVLGSQYYMSPEQIAGEAEIDARTDIWSMGVVLYRLVTGALPFPGKSMCQFIARLLDSTPPPPSAVRPGLPPALDAVLARVLEKKPALRYQRMGDLAAALKSAVRIHAPARAPGGTAARRVGLLAATLGLTTLAATWGLPGLRTRSPDATLAAELPVAAVGKLTPSPSGSATAIWMSSSVVRIATPVDGAVEEPSIADVPRPRAAPAPVRRATPRASSAAPSAAKTMAPSAAPAAPPPSSAAPSSAAPASPEPASPEPASPEPASPEPASPRKDAHYL